MNIDKSIRELNDVLVSNPNRHLDSPIEELEEYLFLKKHLIPIPSPLWQQSLCNVAVKLFDLDILSILPDIDNIHYELQNSDVSEALIKYYLLIDVNDYKYEEHPRKHFLVSEKERIDVDVLLNSVAHLIQRDIELCVNAIKAQLQQLSKKDWNAYFKAIELDPEEDKEEIEEFFSELNYFLKD
jgi:hypothetical protein